MFTIIKTGRKYKAKGFNCYIMADSDQEALNTFRCEFGNLDYKIADRY